jgi:hypothetical protein
MKPFTCPVCGEEVPPNAKACPECGACDRSGWSEDRHTDGLDLPDDEEDFDYDKFLEEEFGQSQRRKGVPLITWIIALVVLFAFLAMSLHTFVGLFGR